MTGLSFVIADWIALNSLLPTPKSGLSSKSFSTRFRIVSTAAARFPRLAPGDTIGEPPGPPGAPTGLRGRMKGGGGRTGEGGPPAPGAPGPGPARGGKGNGGIAIV